METRGQACGKVILLGEHAVVYGVPAIAVGIDRGARAVAGPVEGGPSRLRVRGWNIAVRDNEDGHDLARAFRALLDASHGRPSLDHGLCRVEVEADLPPGGGLGCSAAMGVAIARAVDPDRDRRRAPGARDGLGARLPRQPQRRRRRRLRARRLRRSSARASRSSACDVRGRCTCASAAPGIASSTKSMVDGVARLRARRPERRGEDLRGRSASLVNNARARHRGTATASRSGRLMDLNQMLLERPVRLDVRDRAHVRARARRRARSARSSRAPAVAAASLALVPSPAVGDAVLAAWRAEGFDGVRHHRRARDARGPSRPRPRARRRRERARRRRRAPERRAQQVLGQARQGQGTSPRCRASRSRWPACRRARA